MRVEAYALRRGSGGAGRWRGGDGVVRRYRFLDDARVTLLTERRRHAPWGLAGGEAGQVGENRLDGEPLDGKCSLEVRAGQVLEIRTPGGGGYGALENEAGPSAEGAGVRAPSGSSSG
jgi:N-methylhydantoinase B